MKESFIKYPKIKILGHKDNKGIFDNPDDDIVIEEKMDGANTRFIVKDGKIYFGSRNTIIDESSMNFKSWSNSIQFIKEKVNTNKELEGYIFFGESMIPHSLSYDWNKIPPFLAFDIYDMNNNIFLDYDNKIKIFNKLNLSVVPLVKITKAKEITSISDNNVPPSKYISRGKNNQAEGIVFKNYAKQIFAKYVRNKFKETKKKTKIIYKGDEEKFVDLFCTEARINKIIFKLIDEGYQLEMKLMEKLPMKVYNDIWEENWQEIIFKKWKLNLKLLRTLVAKQCLVVLKQFIVSNATK